MEESFQKLAETEPNDVRGSAVTSYGLQPVQYLKDVVDGAKEEMQFIHWVKEVNLPKGVHQVSIPKRKQYKGYHGETWNTAGSDIGGSGAGTGPYANTIADLSYNTVNNYDNVTAKPLPVLLPVALQKYALDTNAIEYLKEVRIDLSHDMASYIETKIALALGDATNSTSSAAGAQTIFGGDATSSATLATGDVLTTDIITDAETALSDLQFGYRASTYYGAETRVAISSYRKNPWQNTTDDPFVLFIGPKQRSALLKDSQFMNAAEFGQDVLIREGKVSPGLFVKYEGMYIVMSNHLERTAASGTAPDTQTAAVACTQCLAIKAKKALSIVYSKKPELEVWDYNERHEKRMNMVMYFDTVVPQPDAIIKILVSDA